MVELNISNRRRREKCSFTHTWRWWQNSVSLLDSILSTFLKKWPTCFWVAALLSHHWWQGSTGLHYEWLLQFRNVPFYIWVLCLKKLQCLLRLKNPLTISYVMNLFVSSVTSSSCLSLSFLRATAFFTSTLLSHLLLNILGLKRRYSTTVLYTVLYSKVHTSTITCTGCMHMTM